MPSRCHCQQPCSLGYIISSYVTPLMQSLTNDIKTFNMGLITTKCLNTAVMVLYFFIGIRALSRADTCDSTKLRERFLQGGVNTLSVLFRLKTSLMRPTKHRYVYYIMINDGYIEYATGTPNAGNKAYFPGHVFVIEKFTDSTSNHKMSFNLFQSYINKYDLKGYLQKTGKESFTYTHGEMMKFFIDLHYFLNAPVWDQRCYDFWLRFTKVKSDEFMGTNHSKVLSLCYTYDKVKNCLKNIETYTKEKIQEVDKLPSSKIYGNESLYDNAQSKLTNNQMRESFHAILNDINLLKNNVS